MSDNTVRVDSNVTVDAEDLRRALDSYETHGGPAFFGDVAVFDDGDDDDAIYVVNTDDGTATDIYKYPSNLRDKIDEQVGPQPFDEYLLDIGNVGSANDVEEDEYHDGVYDAVLVYNFFSGSEVKALVEDDGVVVGKVRAEDGQTKIHVDDTR